ncbi:hypothetical protein CA13_13030 [Planctomycetes bacterium CA13]|uniref:Uncharacterized protein n=1 Tax=Novipirellula herctigrandis TaxID=2527986 RepID=A0A5C5YXW3_9BACT|nr:hypothetical protein CA13_13030 [Planctomycetes bacterium CA13]
MKLRGQQTVALTDLVLVALATIVIALHWIPLPEPRQQVAQRASDGRYVRYTLPIRDPRIVAILDNKEPMPSVEQLTERWRGEALRFYAEDPRMAELDAASGKIVQVAFTDSTAFPKIPTKDANKGKLAIGSQVQPPHTIIDFAISLAIGICVATLFALWNVVFPAFRLRHPQSQTAARHHVMDRSVDGFQGVLAIEIEPNWISIRQPWMVRIRQISLFAIVAVAITTLLV